MLDTQKLTPRSYTFPKTHVAFVVMVIIATVAAVWWPGDRVHIISAANDKGGMVVHPAEFQVGKSNYQLVVTGSIKEPLKGDFKVALEPAEGSPSIEMWKKISPIAGYEIYSSFPPAIRMPYHKWSEFKDNTLMGMNPGDNYRLWVQITKPMSGTYFLTFTHVQTGKKVLKIPVAFESEMDKYKEKSSGGGGGPGSSPGASGAPGGAPGGGKPGESPSASASPGASGGWNKGSSSEASPSPGAAATSSPAAPGGSSGGWPKH